MTHERFLARCVELAEEGVRVKRGGPFGALIVRGDKIIAEGSNEVFSTNDPTAHAEIVVIRRACNNLNTFDLSGCVMSAL